MTVASRFGLVEATSLRAFISLSTKDSARTVLCSLTNSSSRITFSWLVVSIVSVVCSLFLKVVEVNVVVVFVVVVSVVVFFVVVSVVGVGVVVSVVADVVSFVVIVVPDVVVVIVAGDVVVVTVAVAVDVVVDTVDAVIHSGMS